MKLTVNEFEIEIKAKARWNSKANKEDAMNILNRMSIWASEAAQYNNKLGHTGLAEEWEQAASQIYEYLKINGAYKGL